MVKKQTPEKVVIYDGVAHYLNEGPKGYTWVSLDKASHLDRKEASKVLKKVEKVCDKPKFLQIWDLSVAKAVEAIRPNLDTDKNLYFSVYISGEGTVPHTVDSLIDYAAEADSGQSGQIEKLASQVKVLTSVVARILALQLGPDVSIPAKIAALLGVSAQNVLQIDRQTYILHKAMLLQDRSFLHKHKSLASVVASINSYL